MKTSEIFDIKGYEGLYGITMNGMVWSRRRNRFMILQKPLDYYTVTLRKECCSKTNFIHKLLAQTFIPNPFNKKQVNHMDGNKLNNNLTNLEWCTPSENMRHAVKTGLFADLKGEKNPSAKLSSFKVQRIR